jgi:hypothetical protein
MAPLPHVPAPRTVQQQYPLQQLPLNIPHASVCRDFKLLDRPESLLVDCYTQTDTSEGLHQSTTADGAAHLRPELQRQIRDAVAMRRGVAAALQQAQDRAQAQVRINGTSF